VLAKTYGQLPHQILKECDLVEFNLNMHVLLAGQKAEIEAAQKAQRNQRS
jgi:hypothetical protein